MPDQTYAAIASARHQRRFRRKLPLRLIFFVILALAAAELLFFRQTPQALQDLAAHNPETAAYVQDYNKYKGTHFDIDLSGDVTPGRVPHFLQWDQRWGYETYGGSMIAALDAGKLLIASVGPEDFTETGHFIVLCGWDGEAFEVRDPNSRANTDKTWTYEVLEHQIKGLWAFSV